MVVGHFPGGTPRSNTSLYGHKKIEHFINGEWVIKGEFPFVTDYIYGYSMTSLNNDLYLFGTKEVNPFLSSQIQPFL